MNQNVLALLLEGADASHALASAAEYARASKAASTRRVYNSALRAFSAWRREAGRSGDDVDAGDIAAYFADLADRGVSAATVNGHASAIGWAMRQAGAEPIFRDERVQTVLRGIRRTIGAPAKGKDPATAGIVSQIVRHIPAGLKGKRDRALILIGFAAALRRSELVALDVEDVRREQDGVVLTIRRSKTDQEGFGAEIAVPDGMKLKPVAALDAWIAAAKIDSGPIFRSFAQNGAIGDRLGAQSVAHIVKRRAAAAGLDPESFAGHSLRAGFVTSALSAGADIFRVMDVTRHTEVRSLRAYDRRARAFDNHAGKEFL
jgi:site-specific recombinase XerD